MKTVEEITKDIQGKNLSLLEIDDYMIEAGYESIMPIAEDEVAEAGLIWYPFEPFLNQINIWLEPSQPDRYIIVAIEHFSDVEG